MAKKVASRASGSGRWGSPRAEFVFRKLEATPRIELGMEVLQTSALPLGYVAAQRWYPIDLTSNTRDAFPWLPQPVPNPAPDPLDVSPRMEGRASKRER